MTQEMTAKSQLALVREELLENTEALIVLEAHGAELETREKELLDQIVVEANPEFASNELAHGTGMKWDCDTSPTSLCVYDDEKDPFHMGCLYCHTPEERK